MKWDVSICGDDGETYLYSVEADSADLAADIAMSEHETACPDDMDATVEMVEPA